MTAKNHHYIPEFYLRGFVEDEGSQILTIDLIDKKQFTTNPKNVGSRKYFNRVDIDGLDPDAVEKAMGEKFEGPASAALKRLIEGQLPHEKDEDYIFNVIALLAARSPEKRENWRRFNASIAEGLIGWNLSSKENYEASMSKDSSTTEKEISYEDMKSFFESNAYKIDMSVSSHLEMEIESIDTILPLLDFRSWHVISTNKETGYFVTSDHPVVLTWADKDLVPPEFQSQIGFGLKNTIIYFPIAKTMAWVGVSYGSNIQYKGTREIVARVNSAVIKKTYRQVYAPSLNFYCLNAAGGIKTGHQLVTQIENA